MTKSATKAEGQAAPLKTPTQPAPGTRLVSSSTNYPFATLQRTLGNQAMLELLESGGIQAKLRVSQRGDADESEADRVANHIVSSSYAPKLQRKCACLDGASCPKCAGEEEERKVHRGVSAAPFIQRATADSTTTHLHHEPRELARPAQLIVEDNATKLERGQMKKSAFLKQLKVAVSITADAALAASRKQMKSAPYIEQWLAPYADQDSQQLEQALIKYAPEAARVHSAHEYIPIISNRVERAVISWAKTGKITDVPEDLAKQFTSGGGTGGFFGALQSFASSGVGGAILGFLGGGASSQVQRKAKGGGGESSPGDAASVQAQLGSGHPLDSRVQSQMSSAFGYDFSSVRVHTDSQSAALSASLDARAFTVGKNVAFASGEYQPGTLIGDALIAHELAHVVQQGGGQASAPLTKSQGQGGQLEEDADLSAVGAVASLWAGSVRGLANLKQNAGPRLRSGLRLQRCSCIKGLFDSSGEKDRPSTPSQTSTPGETSTPQETSQKTTQDDAGTAQTAATPAATPACTPGTANCTTTDDPQKIVCDHQVAPDTIVQPGDVASVNVSFSCKVKEGQSDFVDASGASLGLPKNFKSVSSFTRDWDGKRQTTRHLRQALVDDGDYFHNLSFVTFAYQKNTALKAGGPNLKSKKITVRARANPQLTTLHDTPANRDALALIVFSEAGSTNSAAMTAVAWAVRNQMIREGTADVATVQGIYGDAHGQTPSATHQSRTIANTVLNSPIGNDTTQGAIRWYSPKVYPAVGTRCPAHLDCRGPQITIDKAGIQTTVYSPSWSKDMHRVTVAGVSEWDFLFYRL